MVTVCGIGIKSHSANRIIQLFTVKTTETKGVFNTGATTDMTAAAFSDKFKDPHINFGHKLGLINKGGGQIRKLTIIGCTPVTNHTRTCNPGSGRIEFTTRQRITGAVKKIGNSKTGVKIAPVVFGDAFMAPSTCKCGQIGGKIVVKAVDRIVIRSDNGLYSINHGLQINPLMGRGMISLSIWMAGETGNINIRLTLFNYIIISRITVANSAIIKTMGRVFSNNRG